MSYTAPDLADDIEDALDRHGLLAGAERSDLTEVATATLAALAERLLLLVTLSDLVARHDRPHGFSDEHWYRSELDAAREVLAKVQS